MGRRDKERIARIRAGLEEPWAREKLAESSYKGVVRELSKGGTEKRVDRLHSLVTEGVLPESKLKKAITDKAPAEMDKAVAKFRKKGREVSVETLTTEVKSTPGFLKMCEKVGLGPEWFEDLAKERMKASGLKSKEAVTHGQ